MPDFWFLQTVYDNGTIRTRALPEQFIEDGPVVLSVNPAFNVQCERQIRSAYSVGTVFGVAKLTKVANSDHYAAGPLTAVTNPHAGDVIPADMEAAYLAYLARTGAAPVSAPAPASPPKATYLQTLKGRTHLQPPTPEDGFWVPEQLWWPLIRNIENNTATLIVGPTGSGKTELLAYVCTRLGRKFKVHDMGSMVDPIATLVGVHRLENGASVFDFADFTKDIVENNVIDLDELTRAPVGTTNILFPLLDKRQELAASMAGSKEGRVFKRHEDCVITATANIGAEYTGTNTIDRALKDRFFLLEADYPPLAIESRLLVNRCGIPLAEATIIAKVAESVRLKNSLGTLGEAISTRNTIEAGHLVSDGFEPVEAMKLAFLPLFEGSDTKGDRMSVINIISSR